MKRLILALFLLCIATPALAQDAGAAVFRPSTSYQVTLTAATSASTGRLIISSSRFARLMCTVACYVAFSPTPYVLATTVPIFLPANSPEVFRVSPSQIISVGANTAGILYVTEMQ